MNYSITPKHSTDVTINLGRGSMSFFLQRLFDTSVMRSAVLLVGLLMMGFSSYSQSLELGMAVITCYGDTSNPNSIVANVYDVRQNRNAPRNVDWAAVNPGIVQTPSSWTVSNMGEIFGIALDSVGNVYFGASDVYRLDTLYTIHAGHFTGPAGTGGVYMADHANLANLSNLLTTANSATIGALPTTQVPNTGGEGNGIGNLAYDKKHHQLFITNLEDGRIYRVDLKMPTPSIVSVYDPFTLDDGTAGLAPATERLWGIGVYTDTSTQTTKVYFARQAVSPGQSSTVYSVPLTAGGEFDATFDNGNQIFTSGQSVEIVMNTLTSDTSRITDISFSDKGDMLVGERGHPHRAGVYEFIKSGNSYSTGPNYFVGAWSFTTGLDGRNAAGGVSYGYRDNNGSALAECDSMVWATTGYMSNASSGSGYYYGLEGVSTQGNKSVTAGSSGNAFTDIVIDFNGTNSIADKLLIGDVEVYRTNCDQSATGTNGNPTLACNDLVQISLDSTGIAHVTLDMVAEGDINPACWEVELKDINGNVISGDTLRCEHVGTIVDYSIKDTCQDVSCWGKIKVEDKFIPALKCHTDTLRCARSISPDSLGYPVPGTATVEATVREREYVVHGFDSCGDVKLWYNDELLQDFDCDLAYKVMVRKWTAEDGSGNRSMCVDTIRIHLPNLRQDTIGLHDLTFSCNGTWSKLPNGYPSPDATGWPVPAGCTTLVATYSDQRLDVCGATYKVLRHWKVVDWCVGNGVINDNYPKILDFYQVIKVVDHDPPSVYCASTSNMVDTIGMDYYKCSGTYHLPVPEDLEDALTIPDPYGVYVIGECSEWTYRVRHVASKSPQDCTPSDSYGTYLGAARTKDDPGFVKSGLPAGCNWFYYEITDACGNTSSCAFDIYVKDDQLPIAVCEGHTVVTLNLDGRAKVYARSLDDGSIDNCMIDTMLVRRMDYGAPCQTPDKTFKSYVEFCCADAGQRIMVEFKVIDKMGNASVCMVEVEVVDKEAPKVIPLPDLTVNCRYKYDTSDLSSYFGKIVKEAGLREEIEIGGRVVGRDGLATDNCEVTRIEETAKINLHCHKGWIERTFKIYDKQGLLTISKQHISLVDPVPFNSKGRDIRWPRDILDRPLVTNCKKGVNTDPAVTGKPRYSNTDCAHVTETYTDKIYHSVKDACYKIERTWTVIDWCQYAKAGDPIWEHKQYIKVSNYTAPEFAAESCEDKVFCDSSAYDYKGRCIGHAKLKPEAHDDCTPDDELQWRYRLDLGVTGTYGPWRNSEDASGTYETGVHKIEWSVTDGCGNETRCSYEFEVKDCKKPTPYCRDEIVTVIMPTSGEIEIWASDFNIGSSDNCTVKEDLRYSFTEDGKTPNKTFYCSDLEGNASKEIPLTMWVLDEAGNAEGCSVLLKLQDNGDCKSGGQLARISGALMKVTDTPTAIGDVTLYRETGEEVKALEGVQGTYKIEDVKRNEGYELKVRYEKDYGKGVSTRDLVAIQKYLLGKGDLPAPWQRIAADANNSGSISTADILALRKIILGKSQKLKKSGSWRYYPVGMDMSELAAMPGKEDHMRIPVVNTDMDQMNFYGIKIGDVTGEENMQTGGNLVKGGEITLKGEWTEGADDTRVLSVRGDGQEALTALQFTISYPENMTLKKVSQGALQGVEMEYAIYEGRTTVSWYSTEPTVEGELIRFVFEGTISEGDRAEVQLGSEITANEVLTESGVTGVAKLDLSTEVTATRDEAQEGYQLLQNIPNPFKGTTIIPFTLPRAQEVQFIFRNAQGRVLKALSMDGKKGRNSFTISNKELNAEGVIYYQMKCNNKNIVRKMVLL